MGRRGPKPTPTTILRLRGSWRGVGNKSEPQPHAGAPDCPAWLESDARAVWAQVVAILQPTNVLTKAELHALCQYCTTFVRWKTAAEFLAKNGTTYAIKDDAGKVKCVMPWPQVSEYHKFGASLLKLQEAFGMTPSSRSRIQVTSDEKPQQTKSRFFASTG